MGYITYGEEKTQPIQTSTSSGQKLKTGGLSLLGKVGDFLSRGTYASANAVKKIIETTGMATGMDVAREAWHGLKGEDKTTYSDVLDKLGWKAGSGGMANKVARGLVSFTGDVLLDPTTYLTLGTGAGAKIATKEGTTVLTKAGSKALAKSTAELGSRKLAEEAFEKVLKESPEMALKYIDKGGVKFMGKTIAGTTPINAVVNPMNKGLKMAMSPIDKAVSKVTEPIAKTVKKIADIKEVKQIVDKIGGMFDRDYLAKNKPMLKRTVQEGRDLKAGLIQELDQRISKDLKVYTKAEKENVGRALWSRDTSGLTAREQELNNYIQADFAKYFEEEKKRGLTQGEIMGDYLNQMYENPEVLQEIMKKDSQYAKGSIFKEDVFTRKRGIQSEAELKQFNEKYGVELKPIYDVEKLLKARLSHSVSTVTDHDMLTKVINLEGMATKVPTSRTLKSGEVKTEMRLNKQLDADMVKASSVPGLSKVKGADNISIPRTTADYLNSLTPKQIDYNSAGQKFIRGYDKYTNLFKKNVLSLFPAYHSRNFRGNIFQTILEYGVIDAVNPKFHSTSMKVLKGTDTAAKVTIGGVEYTVGELRKIMQANGILQGKGFFDLSNPMQKEGGKLFQLGQRGASYIENEARGATFLMGLEHSHGDIVTAAERTKKALFDYDALSDTEKNVFRRIFPFYTWTSRALKSTIEGTIKRPGNMAAIFKTMDNMQKSSFTGISAEERSLLPEYLQNQFVFKVQGKDGKVRYKTGMGAPIEAIMDLFADPVGNGSFALNPAIKMFITGITRYDFDNGKPLNEVTTKNAQIFKYAPKFIQDRVGYTALAKTSQDGEKYTQYTASPFALYILRQPPFSRYTSTASSLTKDGRQGKDKSLQLLFGINATEQDMKRWVEEAENKYKDEITKPLRQKGIIVKNEYGAYYIPKSVEIDAAQRAAAEEIIKATKDVNYTPSISNPLRATAVSSTPAPKKEKPKVQSKYEAVKTMQARKVNSKASVRKAMKSIQGRVNF